MVCTKRCSASALVLFLLAIVAPKVSATTLLIVGLPWEQHVLHLDYVTALIGAPVMLWILLRNRHLRELA